MNNLQVTEKGAEIRAVLETLNNLFLQADVAHTRLVEAREASSAASFGNGWDLGAHYATIRALRQTMADALAMALPRREER